MLGLHAAVGVLECKLRNVYLVNLDGDYVFTEVWLNQCLERAMVECQSLPADWCDEVCDIVHRGGEPPLRAKVCVPVIPAPKICRLTTPNIAICSPLRMEGGSRWVCREMGTYGRMGMPAMNFILIRGYDENIIDMGVEDTSLDGDLHMRLGKVGWCNEWPNDDSTGFTVPNLLNRHDQMQITHQNCKGKFAAASTHERERRTIEEPCA